MLQWWASYLSHMQPSIGNMITAYKASCEARQPLGPAPGLSFGRATMAKQGAITTTPHLHVMLVGHTEQTI